MASKLKKLIKKLGFGCVDFLVSFFKSNIVNKTVLLIRLDAIGDYVLFRNFIEIIKVSKKYEDYNITLLANVVWKELAIELDSEYVDNFIWLDRKKFNYNLFYRFNKLLEITSKGYEVLINPVYSREFFYTDNIAKLVNARNKIASTGDLSNIEFSEKNISDKYYSQLIEADSNLMFEFYRNKEFFQNLLVQQLIIKKPAIELKNTAHKIQLPENYVVLFLDAGKAFRRWSGKNFAIVGEYIQKKYNLDIILCGTIMDSGASEYNDYLCPEKTINMIGKTSLLELLSIINGAKLLVSNETSIPHFAVALDIKNILVISNGNNFGRFTPYPVGITDKYHVIYPPDIENNLSHFNENCRKYGHESTLDINEINPDAVNKKIDGFFKQSDY